MWGKRYGHEHLQRGWNFYFVEDVVAVTRFGPVPVAFGIASWGDKEEEKEA